MQISEPSQGASSHLAPLVLSHIQAGFSSPADPYIEELLDLNALMVTHPAATFFVRVSGDSMKNAGISSGDILVVDRSIDPGNGKIVVALLNGEFTVKRLRIEGKKIALIPENPAYLPIEIRENSDFQVWGVVTYAIHKCTT